ncbi:hypothetical protein NDN08_004228 [Rhodosorus marinus]|uniref:G domain-containing protein n=1 Tax=Rhodosorus marinus TaxID=101924 RepID=A0AAV8UL67_9RHOD|nr:hypothetical protein NDN08_004228 [Rhodosorus marinus]
MQLTASSFTVVTDGQVVLGGFNGVRKIVCSVGAGARKIAILEELLGSTSSAIGETWEHGHVARGFISNDIGVLDVIGLDGGGAEIGDPSTEEEGEIWETRANLFALLGADVILLNLSINDVARRDGSYFQLINRAQELGRVGDVFVLLHDYDERTREEKLKSMVLDRLSVEIEPDRVFIAPHSKYMKAEFKASLAQARSYVLSCIGKQSDSEQPARLQLAWELSRAGSVPLTSRMLSLAVWSDESAHQLLRGLSSSLESIQLSSGEVGKRLSETRMSLLAEFSAGLWCNPLCEPCFAMEKVAEFNENVEGIVTQFFSDHLSRVKYNLVTKAKSRLNRKPERDSDIPFSTHYRMVLRQAVAEFDYRADRGSMDCLREPLLLARKILLTEIEMMAVGCRETRAEITERSAVERFRATFETELGLRHPVETASLTYWSEVTSTARTVWRGVEEHLQYALDYEMLGFQPSEVSRRVADISVSCHTVAVNVCRAACGSERVFSNKLREVLRARMPDRWPATLSFPQQVREIATTTGLRIALFSFVLLGQLKEVLGQPPPPIVEHFSAEARERLVQDLTRSAEAEGRRALFDQLGHGLEFARTLASVVVGVSNTVSMIR